MRSTNLLSRSGNRGKPNHGNDDDLWAYCKNALNNVSRSFALTIPFIDEPIRDKVTLGYLEARILDTIEDSDADMKTKERMLDLWMNLLTERSRNGFMSGISNKLRQMTDFAKNIDNRYYRNLLKNAHIVLTLHRKMDSHFFNIVKRWFYEMKEGMKKFLSKRISTFRDLDDYSYYVAGTVGGFLTDLISYYIDDKERAETLRRHYRDFGLFLQKVNIIRDFREDVLEKRYFWPSQLFDGLTPEDLLDEKNIDKALEILNMMIANAKQHAHSAAQYISNIPAKFKGYRAFCKVNYLMALRTLDLMEDNPAVFLSEEPVKISKDDKEEILRQALSEL